MERYAGMSEEEITIAGRVRSEYKREDRVREAKELERDAYRIADEHDRVTTTTIKRIGHLAPQRKEAYALSKLLEIEVKGPKKSEEAWVGLIEPSSGTPYYVFQRDPRGIARKKVAVDGKFGSFLKRKFKGMLVTMIEDLS